MELTPEQIKVNWEKFLKIIKKTITSPRQEQLLKFYETYEERIALMPASYKKEFHNSFPGGYIDHVIRVVECSLELNKIWVKKGVDTSTYTIEELCFSAINHDLGKFGNEDHESYVVQDDKWRRDKLGEVYKFNTKLPFASVPDRGLFILQSHGIPYSFNEMVAIQIHDGTYDEGNKKYLMGYSPEQKPRTSLPFILHQADLMASRIEFERVWNPTFKAEKDSLESGKKDGILDPLKKNKSTRGKALSSKGSEGLKNILDTL
tara:strand:- start:11125 stop:11910 length:786 start_codon:yes stop_codon:yes gene_type:complete